MASFEQTQGKSLPLRPYLEKLKQAQWTGAGYRNVTAAFLDSLLLAEPSWGTAKSGSWELGFLPTVFYCGLPKGKIDNRLGLKARSSAVPGYKEHRTTVLSVHGCS